VLQEGGATNKIATDSRRRKEKEEESNLIILKR
jgi:hypothetical protein